jgi:aminoglycoside phosphotransferase (APT) family kinase protein
LTTEHYISDEDLIANPVPLGDWFDARFGDTAPLQLSLVEGGRSNSLLRAQRGHSCFAVRRPPPVASDKTSHNLQRELRLLTALSQTNVPHARLLDGCLEGSPIGGPFIVLEWIEGFCPRDPMPGAFGHDAALRRRIGEGVIDALAAIAAVDWQGIGLADFGNPAGFLQRQVDRWLAQYERAAIRDLPHLQETADWLRANTPSAGPTALIHGDFSLANVLVRPSADPQVYVIDWELATIGDPLLDLGHLLSSWEDHQSGPTWAHYIDWHNGFCSRAEAAERYARATGLDISHLKFYMVLALFRLAVILEGVYALWLRGQGGKAHHETYADRVPAILAQAGREIERN